MSPLWNVYDVSLRIARSNEADRMVTAHFMFLAAFPLSTLLPQDLSHSGLKMERLHVSRKPFWAWLKLIIPLSPFFSRLMQMRRLAAWPASLDLMFTFGPVGGREIRAVKQMLVEDGTTTLNDTIRQNAQSMSRIAIQELLFEAQLTFPENTSSILWLPANSGQHRQQVYLS